MHDTGPNKANFYAGFLASLVAHLLGAVVVIMVLESTAARAARPPEVFTVTLEGGTKLGGVDTVPKVIGKKPKALPNQHEPTKEEKAVKPKAEKKLTAPSVVDDVEKKRKEKELAKKAAEKKKEAEAKKKAESKKKQAELAKKRAEEEKAKKKAQEEERKKRLDEAISRAKTRYEGESYNAGGEGLGAAALGGQGMGGGTAASLEFVAYGNQLKEHIKSGWRWLAGQEQLQAQVLVNILPSGVIQDASIARSSGNRKFDDSVLRAVYKSSPVPPAPARLYSHFKEVRITFDSHQ